MAKTTMAGYVPPTQESPKKTPESPKKKRKKRKGISGVTLAALIIFLLAVLGSGATIFVYTQTQPFADRFVPNVSLSGYPLTGATYEEGRGMLQSMMAEKIAAWQYELVWQGASYLVTADDIGLSVDEEETLAPLWAAGREEGMLARFLAMEHLRQNPLAGEPVVVYDLGGAEGILQRLADDVNCESVDATVEYVPGSAAPFRYTDEETGYTLDLEPIRDAIRRSVEQLTPGRTEVKPGEKEPGVYRAVLENNTKLRARVLLTLEDDADAAANAALAALALNGTMLAPGESLSFNQAVGARNADAGYVSARESAFGEGVTGIGGGVCQSATALYQLALTAELPVTERHAAARPVSYAEVGMEAAVSGQGLDLVIENDTGTPLFLLMRVYEEDKTRMLEAQLIGAPMQEKVRIASESEETELIEEPVYLRDSEGRYATYTDERVEVGKAQPGIRARVYRVILTEEGQEEKRELISEDTYDPVPPTIYVGTEKR